MCCVLIALVLGPLGLSATALGGGACCTGRTSVMWTATAVAILVLACGTGAWLVLGPPPPVAFSHICSIFVLR